ncbi:MAG: flagellar export protein FliJ [Gemmatimonadota bacterium]
MFRFRLQRVLELREESEQAKARLLAAAQDAADAARREQEALAAMRDSSRAELHAAHADAPRIGHLHQLGFVLQSLDQRVQNAGEVVHAADEVVASAQGELTDAARDRRVLDRLKERHAESWRAEEAHKDKLQMDEIALARFGRKNDGTSHT